MEPMTLGSPVGSSPSSPSPYLPGYLMGDPMPQPTSPSKTPRQIHFVPSLSTPMQNSGTIPTPGSASLNDSLSRFHKNQREKSGGPPTVGLFDTLDVSTSALSTMERPSTPQQSTLITQPVHQSAMSTSTNSINLEEHERWVTVFGFPPAAASAIVAQFSQVGHIVEHRFPGQGNWVNICYASKLDARRALSYNGKILGGHTMVGVVPCQDPLHPRKLKCYGFKTFKPPKERLKISSPFVSCSQSANALKDMTNVLSSTATPSTPKTPQMSRLSQRRLITSPSSSPYITTPRGGRPLGITSPTDSEVTGAQNTPTKNTSFVTKAVDFVFGW